MGPLVSRGYPGLHAGVFLVVVLLVMLLGGCSTLRPLKSQLPSWSLEPDVHSRLGRFTATLPRGEGADSAFRLLESGRSALLARLALAERAERSLDLQYYLFHADTTGRLLAEALLRAADRGVRVRVLLDDVDSGKHEGALIGLDAHPNIEIRLFNPFTTRGDNPLGRGLEFLGKGHLNHRMHNKLFIADSVLAITGGRNVGDAYFQADGAVAFRDLDILAAGPVLDQMRTAFDDYWNSPYAVSARALPKPAKRARLLNQVREALEQHLANLGQDALFEYMGLDVLEGEGHEFSPWLPGQGRFISDSPLKPSGALPAAQLSLAGILGPGLAVREELLVASPYFVPGLMGVDLLTYLRNQGARVRVLTNSVGATDVLVVHAGYAKYRAPLVMRGVELWELRPAQVPHRFFRRLAGSTSRTSLHSKVMVFDRHTVYVGSMNLDPRSIFTNTEAGLLVRSRGLAQRAAQFIEADMQATASYRVRWQRQDDGDGRPRGRYQLVWEDGNALLREEPHMDFWSRLIVDVFSDPRWEEWL